MTEAMEVLCETFKEQNQPTVHKPANKILTLSHPGFNNQSILLSEWIDDIEDIQSLHDEGAKTTCLENLKKNLKRRLTIVVGADTEPMIFQLFDAYDEVEAAIDQSDDFGKVVAEHLKTSAASKSTEAERKKRVETPFRRSGFSVGAGEPAYSYFQFPHPAFCQQSPPDFLQFIPPQTLGQPRGSFYPAFVPRTCDKSFAVPQRACFNCNQHGHIAASCPIKKWQWQFRRWQP
ncbi:zinc knuckle [Oesophagostomum dentatum]|uniref:Zinc knuckle n=1 Tax=Oesophagostomum dentatum TaxID=61180 RepID=A0A0B1TP02_OESDE|nr:zinc knuckle [Oesophagostomum dentatum]